MKDRLKILVVDDEPDVHAVLVEHLERWGLAPSRVRLVCGLRAPPRSWAFLTGLRVLRPPAGGRDARSVGATPFLELGRHRHGLAVLPLILGFQLLPRVRVLDVRSPPRQPLQANPRRNPS
jgi:CheY-like chemotaxis protein